MAISRTTGKILWRKLHGSGKRWTRRNAMEVQRSEKGCCNRTNEMKPRKYTEVYQFKIILWVKPRVWRRIQVPGNYTFYALHSAIQDAVGWEDKHLHEFSFDFDPVTREETRIGDPDDSDEFMGTGKFFSEFRERISRWFTPKRKTISYRYDFGDGWSHT